MVDSGVSLRKTLWYIENRPTVGSKRETWSTVNIWLTVLLSLNVLEVIAYCSTVDQQQSPVNSQTL